MLFLLASRIAGSLPVVLDIGVSPLEMRPGSFAARVKFTCFARFSVVALSCSADDRSLR
jgi:hypothetical protein